MKIATMAEMQARGEVPEILFWVGCAGSFDARAQRVSRAFAELLTRAGISFAILGNEESCTGDPARRAGNEFLFQMLAHQNIETLNGYGVTRIVTTCPHCFNTLRNEYPELGGHYEVVHHTMLLDNLIKEGRLQLAPADGQTVTYHDSCYLGRVNEEYQAPRSVLQALRADLAEMPRCKSNGLCCGAGGAQMFKEDEPGDKRINTERVEEAVATGAGIVAANCPFCITMLQDGIKEMEREDVMVYDISELILNQLA
ncbi:MAG: (Fe-S)-binding protein [Saprospiraceae bacterium]|nr:(Fe-S)-binding protein [Saprospiraceae bacterium]